MKQILFFCVRDWLHPRAGGVERYVHEVCLGLADSGHYVAWVSSSFPLFGRVKRPRTEIVDGIQLARLGVWPLYRLMAGMFLKNKATARYDVIIDCVNGKPLAIADKTDVPVVPLVFNLHRKVYAAEDPPGPVIAATNEARLQLIDAGLPEDLIVQAAKGESWDKTTAIILATIEDIVHVVH